MTPDSTQIEQHYPPNAFHTHWALRLLNRYEERKDELALPALSDDIAVKRATARLWCNRTLSAQTALIRGGAARVDAHQLAWALVADHEERRVDSVATEDAPAPAANDRRDLYAAALEAFFGAQTAGGGWPLYEPLFHYPQAGNAYCYTFETLAELLRPALNHRDGRVLRQLLFPHLEHLVLARQYAERTAIALADGGLGWTSGHHPHRQHPEAWATAAVFSYLQALRRLVGYWSAGAAKRALSVRAPKYSDPAEGDETLRSRASTWTTAEHPLTVGRQLAGLFLHPRRRAATPERSIDPDRPLIPDDEARSAILFGPPGTGKTTLTEALAASIGWDFAEVPASVFVRGGMDQVPAEAERIFAQLMELDHCVVLFDEVDELIRDRRSEVSDPFGRFLTTSMLPKLTKLWAQRRVLFFVATNSIDKADPAIRRSQRFDASIFTAPASFEVKYSRLRELLGCPLPEELTAEQVNSALSKTLIEAPAGVFALLRWDQIPELANLIGVKAAGAVPTWQHVMEALRAIGMELARLEYYDEKTDAYAVWRAFWENARRDYGRPLVAATRDPDFEQAASRDDAAITAITYFDIRGASLFYDNGLCELETGGGRSTDDGILTFRRINNPDTDSVGSS